MQEGRGVQEIHSTVEERPARTALLTCLIADVRGYTAFSASEGDEAGARLASRFADITEEIVRSRGGTLVELRGDEAFVVFHSVRDAMRAAVELQDRFAAESTPDLPLGVGIGIDAGEVIALRGGYRGSALNLAARLCSLAGPGETFVSEGAVLLARRVQGLTAVDRGEVALKGLPLPVRVFQLGGDGTLPDILPPLAPAAAAHPTNLPDAPTAFIGREPEVAAICELLQRPGIRLVTLTGPGGSGKSRLALQGGGMLLPNYPNGVYWVSLAPVHDHELVMSVIAAALGIQESSGRPMEKAITEAIGEGRTLLVLDNFEHLIEASPAVAELLNSCRNLDILVTSRVVLHLAREQECPVRPLPVPDLTHLPSPDVLLKYEAVRLFLERARAVRPEFTVNDESWRTIVRIVARLDGLPLAIELAAARVRLFSPDALLSRLDRSLKLLTGGARDLPEHQQTLRGTIDWSYQLLGDDDKRLLERMAVFEGGGTLDAIEALANPDGDFDTVEGITSLVEKSLLQQEQQGSGEPRFWMLETIREYAWEHLAEYGAAASIRDRHLAWMEGMTRDAEGGIRGAEQSDWLVRLDTESGNLRSTLEWAYESGKTATYLTVAANLWRYWWVRGQLTEGRRTLERAVTLSVGEGSRERFRVLTPAAVMAWAQGDFTRAEELNREALELAEAISDPVWTGVPLNNLGILAEQRGQNREALDLYSQAHAVYAEAGERWNTAQTLSNMAGVLVPLGEYDRAAEILDESLATWRELGDRLSETRALNTQVFLAQRLGQHREAARLQSESLRLCDSLGLRENMAVCFEGAARTAIDTVHLREGVVFWAVAEKLRAEMGQEIAPVDREERDRYVQRAAEAMGEEEVAAALEAGSGMLTDAAVAHALDVLGEIEPVR
ncbi:MAG: ATP-binding protein [Chloroflexota bacterium]